MRNHKEQINSRPCVVILQRGLTTYRERFFDRLKQHLENHGVQLNLVHGQFNAEEGKKGDSTRLPWAVEIRNRYFNVLGRELVWQPAWPHTKDADLLIVEQANRLLFNYPMLLRRGFDKSLLAFWGHGQDFQATERDGLLAHLKAFYSRHVDWWFAYTELSKSLVLQTGMPSERISVVNNAADTDVLNDAISNCTAAELQHARDQVGIDTQMVVVYCGGLYALKRVDFMLETAHLVHARLPEFRFLVIGSGPEAEKVEAKAKIWPWLKYVGPRFGAERVPLMKLAKLQFMPGAVGLGIVDSFALQVPLVTTDIPQHGPEISYLENGLNGVMTENDPKVYADMVRRLLLDEERMEQLRSGCRESASRYTVEKMVDNFADGILKCLETVK